MSEKEETQVEATEAPEPSAKALEEEGDIAADYLEELLDIFDLDGDIDIDVRQGRIAGTGIITKPRPCGHNISIIGGSQCGKIGPHLGEFAEIGTDGGDRGLLQHDFRQPDMIWVRISLPRQFSPWQGSGMNIIMRQQTLGDIPRILVSLLDGRHGKWHGLGNG